MKNTKLNKQEKKDHIHLLNGLIHCFIMDSAQLLGMY